MSPCYKCLYDIVNNIERTAVQCWEFTWQQLGSNIFLNIYNTDPIPMQFNQYSKTFGGTNLFQIGMNLYQYGMNLFQVDSQIYVKI